MALLISSVVVLPKEPELSALNTMLTRVPQLRAKEHRCYIISGIQAKLALSRRLRRLRGERRLTQTKAASLLKTSQRRLAQHGKRVTPSASFDLLVRGLFALGATWKETEQTEGGAPETRPRVRGIQSRAARPFRVRGSEV